MGGVMAGARSNLSRVANLAALVEHECTELLVLYRKQEKLPDDMGSDRLVFVSPPSSQLDTRSKLLSLHSALDKCHRLLERAITLEEEELDLCQMQEYKDGRRRLKGHLWNLVRSIEELLKAAGGKADQNLDDSEPYHPNSVFQLKQWMYSILMEVQLWSKTAVTVLLELQYVGANEPLKRSKRSKRSTWQ